MQPSGHAHCPAEEAGAAHIALLLVPPEQPLEERRGLMEQLVNNLSAVLGTAEASEAAAVHASQTEQPHPDEVMVITHLPYYI